MADDAVEASAEERDALEPLWETWRLGVIRILFSFFAPELAAPAMTKNITV